jgi:glycosyltransferase involved in cell wall biosynthesis
MIKPRVSILLITYNRPRFIAQSIESALMQTYKDWEVIIVDDSENDETEKAVKPFVMKDKRIQYFHRPQRGSIANASNFGLAKAHGEYVAILDDDDWWLDDKKLEKQVRFLDERRDYVGVGGGFILMNEEGKVTGKVLKPETDGAIRRVALFANPMVNSTGVFRRAAGGLYDESLRQFADFDIWLRLGTKGKLYNFPEYFLAYRMWAAASSFINQKQNADAGYRIVARYKNDYPSYAKAFVMANGYRLYARFPLFVRKRMNGFLSRLKKYLFSG